MSIINNPETTSITIDTVTPTLQLGQIQISADRKTIDKSKPLSDAERIRRIVLPSNYWGNLSASMNGSSSQSLTDILTSGLKTIANAKLRDFLMENPLARTVPLIDFSISHLLAWSAESASSRGALTFDRDQIEAWFPTSKLFILMATKGTAWTSFMLNRLGTLAAKNHGLKKSEDADKLITLLEADATDSNASPLVSELIQRLAHISKALAARANSPTTLSLDDL